MGNDVSRWVCHTCRVVYIVELPPSVKTQPNGLPPSADLLRTTIRCIELVFDSWGFGRTISSMIPHLKECMLWRQKHKGHRTEILAHGRVSPVRYVPEKRYSPDEMSRVV